MDDNKHMKRCWESLVIKRVQMKATMRYHFTPNTMSKIKNNYYIKSFQKCRETGTLIHGWWNVKLYNHFGKQFDSLLQL